MPDSNHRIKMQAHFFPAETVVDRCIGQAELIFANAILLRGISVLQQGSSGKLSLRFPTYGPRKDSYVIPENKEVYKRMLRVIRMTVKESGFHASEIPGATDLSIFTSVDPTADGSGDLWFDLHLKDLCIVKGIAIHRPHLHTADHVDITLPALSFSVKLRDFCETLPIFQGLVPEHAVMINQKPCKDCAYLIKDLVLLEHQAYTQSLP